MEREQTHRVPAILLVIALVLLAAGFGVPAAAEERVKTATETAKDSFTAPHMVLTKEEKEALEKEAAAAPKYSAPGHIPPGSFSLLQYIPYNATERSQGAAGDCWVWAGTGALEIEHMMKYGIYDRLSIQYFLDNSGIGPQGYYAACRGGGAVKFGAWYNNKTADPGLAVIPWSNTNAAYNPHCSIPFTPAPPVSVSPAYHLERVTVSTVPVRDLPEDTAINNIKSALNEKHAVIFSYHYSPADANAFHAFWRDEPETAIWNPARCNGDTGEGGHDMLIVGYDDKTDPKNPYWIVLNSWGAPANRPDGTFRLAMNMNYSAVYYDQDDRAKSHPYPQHGFWILDAAFADTPPAPVIAGISPSYGPEGTRIAITGIGFTRASGVLFGNTPAASFTVTSDSTMTAVAPAGIGQTAITVITPEGKSPASAASEYSYGTGPGKGGRSPVSPIAAAGAVGLAGLLIWSRRQKV